MYAKSPGWTKAVPTALSRCFPTRLVVHRTPAVATAAAGVMRRMIFDYGVAAQHGRPGTSTNHRHVCLSVLPGTRIPAFYVNMLTEFFVLAGQMTINGADAGPASFVIVEPDTEAAIASDFGAMLLACADGTTHWSEKPDAADLFGF